jgi:hypothetical protein
MKYRIKMKLYLACFACGSAFFSTCFSQNLVPNPSFETNTGCPGLVSQSVYPSSVTDEVSKAYPWHMTTWGTSDYINSCAPGGMVDVPDNFAGFQYAYHGEAYAGMILQHVFTGGYREYISAPLLDTLIAGTTYYASMRVNWGGPVEPPIPGFDSLELPTNRVGMYFSDGLPDTTGIVHTYIPVVAQVDNWVGNFIDDTLNWQMITGSFVANGDESYITIGNFYPDSQCPPLGLNQTQIYVYVDAVCVSDQPNDCDIYLSNRSLEKISDYDVFPNPTNGPLKIESKNGDENAEIKILDLNGRIVFRTEEMSKNLIEVNLGFLEAGTYLVVINEVHKTLLIIY